MEAKSNTAGANEGRQANPGASSAQTPAFDLYYTKSEVALRLKVSIRTVTEMMGRGELPYLKIGGKLVRFRAADVETHIAKFLCVAGLPVQGQRKEGENACGHQETGVRGRVSENPTQTPAVRSASGATTEGGAR